MLTFVLAMEDQDCWLPFGLMVAQALLGGLAVLLVLPKWMVLAHACLAQLCFGVLVAQTLGWPWQVATCDGRGFRAAVLAVVALFAQTILGAAVRHQIGRADAAHRGGDRRDADRPLGGRAGDDGAHAGGRRAARADGLSDFPGDGSVLHARASSRRSRCR